MVTEGTLTGTRIALGTQPVLIGRADDSTLEGINSWGDALMHALGASERP